MCMVRTDTSRASWERQTQGRFQCASIRGRRTQQGRSRSTIQTPSNLTNVSAFKFVRYVRDPNGRDWLPIETFVGDADQLENELRRLLVGKPVVVDFMAPNGDLLNLGIGGPVAYAAFATAEMIREGTTVGAEGTVDDETPEWVEFEMGGTPTPINRRDLVKAEELLAIAKHFFETGRPDPRFNWA